MATLYLCTKATDFSKAEVNFNDLNDPQTHLKMLKGHYDNIGCDFPTEMSDNIKINPEVAYMLSRYNVTYIHADNCPYPVKTFFPLLATKVKKEILDLCILRGFTVARMVKKYGDLL